MSAACGGETGMFKKERLKEGSRAVRVLCCAVLSLQRLVESQPPTEGGQKALTVVMIRRGSSCCLLLGGE